MNKANKLKPLTALFFCTSIVFGCDDNSGQSQQKTVNTEDRSAAVQGKQAQIDGLTYAQSTARFSPTFSKETEKSDRLSEEERQATQLSDADRKVYPTRGDKTEPQPLDPAAISGIKTQSEHYYQSVKADARIQALEEIGKISGDSPVAINTFIDALNDPDTRVRVEAVNQLADSNQDEALNGLLAALNDANPEVVIEALNNLAFADDPALTEKILPLLSSPNDQVSDAAAQAIENLK